MTQFVNQSFEVLSEFQGDKLKTQVYIKKAGYQNGGPRIGIKN